MEDDKCPHTVDWLLDTLTQKEDLMFVLNHSRTRAPMSDSAAKKKTNGDCLCADKKEMSENTEVKTRATQLVSVF